jgi:hypothetical protein
MHAPKTQAFKMKKTISGAMLLYGSLTAGIATIVTWAGYPLAIVWTIGISVLLGVALLIGGLKEFK